MTAQPNQNSLAEPSPSLSPSSTTSAPALVLSNSGKRMDQAGKKKYLKQVTGRMNSVKLQQHGRVFSDQLASPQASGRIRNSSAMELGPVSMYSQMVKDVWRGKKFSLKELEVATNGFSKQNLIGNGDYGIVYHGILFDNTRVAVKRLVSDRFQVEDFIAEMEAIGFVRHKNLVKLLGYHIKRAYSIAGLESECGLFSSNSEVAPSPRFA